MGQTWAVVLCFPSICEAKNQKLWLETKILEDVLSVSAEMTIEIISLVAIGRFIGWGLHLKGSYLLSQYTPYPHEPEASEVDMMSADCFPKSHNIDIPFQVEMKRCHHMMSAMVGRFSRIWWLGKVQMFWAVYSRLRKGQLRRMTLVANCCSSLNSNPMDKTTHNLLHYQYSGQNSNKASSVTMYIIGANWTHTFYAQQGYTEWAATLLSCVKVVIQRLLKHKGKVWNSLVD